MVVGKEDSGVYMTEPEVDGKVGGNLEENKWMSCTKGGREIGS